MRSHFCARRWLRTRRPRLTPSPCSPTGSDALVGILVGDKEEPSSKRGHGDACASAGGVRTAMLASRPLREGRAPAVRVRRPAFGTGQTSSVLTSYTFGPEVHASVTCVGFNNDPHITHLSESDALGFTLAERCNTSPERSPHRARRPAAYTVSPRARAVAVRRRRLRRGSSIFLLF